MYSFIDINAGNIRSYLQKRSVNPGSNGIFRQAEEAASRTEQTAESDKPLDSEE